jgi:hypothetical protein
MIAGRLPQEEIFLRQYFFCNPKLFSQSQDALCCKRWNAVHFLRKSISLREDFRQ